MKKHLLLLPFILFGFISCASHVTSSESETKTVIVKKAPRQYKVVHVNGKRYYLWNGKYHRKTKRGYILVKV